MMEETVITKEGDSGPEETFRKFEEKIRRWEEKIRRYECVARPKAELRRTEPSLSATLTLNRKGRQWSGLFWFLLLFFLPLTSFTIPSRASNTVACPTEQYIRLRGRAVVKCNGLEDFSSIYWFDSINEDATAFIQKVNGEVTGPSYTAGEFDINNEGSLVIYNVTIRDDRTFQVRALDSSLIASSDDVTVTVFVEPDETIPVVPECSGQSTCVLKGESDRVISCIHGQSRPAMEVSWFLRDGREDRLLNTVNHMMSADSVTFTSSTQLAIEKISSYGNTNQLLVLVCKSVQAVPGMKGTERQILLDISVDAPFTNKENVNRVYAFERQKDFRIKYQSEHDTANTVVLWMYKSLISDNFENILYSAYGDVAITEKNVGFNITDDGALVIKEVDLQNEGYYACVSSSEATTVSFGQNLEVIVLPQPPRIVVKGCEPFQPCHLSAQEAETITCTVNGVRPQVDLSIVTYSENVSVIKTTVSSHIGDGLFYTTVTGQVDVSKVTCEENNVTVFCQAQGPAAYGFMSDAHITLLVVASTEKTDDVVGCNDRQLQDRTSNVTGVVIVQGIVITLLMMTVVIIVLHYRVRRHLKDRVTQLQCNGLEI